VAHSRWSGIKLVVTGKRVVARPGIGGGDGPDKTREKHVMCGVGDEANE
jgi:hypothetical protein